MFQHHCGAFNPSICGPQIANPSPNTGRKVEKRARTLATPFCSVAAVFALVIDSEGLQGPVDAKLDAESVFTMSSPLPGWRSASFAVSRLRRFHAHCRVVLHVPTAAPTLVAHHLISRKRTQQFGLSLRFVRMGLRQAVASRISWRSNEHHLMLRHFRNELAKSDKHRPVKMDVSARRIWKGV
jgi:hypothetical protein